MKKAGVECNDLTIEKRVFPTEWRYLTIKTLHATDVVHEMEIPIRVRRSGDAGATQELWAPDGRLLVPTRSGDATRWEREETVKVQLHPVRVRQQ